MSGREEGTLHSRLRDTLQGTLGGRMPQEKGGRAMGGLYTHVTLS